MLEEPKILNVNNEKYICGGYYNKIYQIFRKNYDSGYKFEFYDNTYIDKMLRLT
jgi:hypothetical protein